MSSLSRTVQTIAMSAMACMFSLSTPGKMPAAESIDNGRLRVTVDVDAQQFSITDKTLGRAFVKQGTFVRGVTAVEKRSVEDAVWGAGHQLTVSHTDGWTTAIRLYADHPFAHLSPIAANKTKEPISISRLKVLEFEYDLGIAAEKVRTLGTGGIKGAKADGSYTFIAAADPETRRGVVGGWLTHERGVGVFFPDEIDGRTSLAAQIELGQFQVAPGKTRATETMVIGYFDDARLGLEAYADAVARQVAVKLPPQPSVYCTWYHGGASNEKKLADNTAFAAEHLKPFGLSVMQIDDHWQAILPKDFRHEGKIQTTGPIKVFAEANNNFPQGMAHTAGNIDSHGLTAGIWFMPFAGNFRNPYFDPDIFAKNPDGTPFHDSRWSGTCLDMSHPKARAFVAGRVKRIYDWGYRYFKLDGMHTGAPSYNIYVNKGYRDNTLPDSRLHDPAVTQVEAYRKGLQIVRENAPDAFVLGCNVSQNMISMGPAFGLIDGMRIGPDNGSAGGGNMGGVKVGAWHGSTLYFLNGRVWHNDPDPVYVRASNPIAKARLMCSWVAVTGSMLTTSYQFSELPPERLDLLRRTMPGHGLLGRPVDLFETDQPRIWLLTDTRRNVRRDVIGLFNWNEKEPAQIVYDMGKLGLDPEKTYAAFDFWENKFIGTIQGTLRLTVPGASCRVLAVRPIGEHPQLLSTSRHIAQCMVDVLDEQWDSTTRTLSGQSEVVAGDRYEMRITLPADGAWKVKRAVAEDQQLTPSEPVAGGLRVSFTPKTSGKVRWSVQF
ncbi:MAG: hypothetical protein HQ567_18925 [Candidatus Nealsonbacteria bacterium]|nr:hypothetical protein [Candidatus Nealsonbacteria bacterium]